MGQKINIAELLKNCPSGMELDCPMFESIEFDSIVDNDYFPIRCRIKDTNNEYNFYNFTKYGYWNTDYKAKCVIFPKGKTTWDRFVPPCKFKAGDILYIDCSNKKSDGDVYKYIFILKEIDSLGNYFSYCHLSIDGLFSTTQYLAENKYKARFATEEEKEKLFQAIKDNGFRWNDTTKALDIISKFKDGDIIYNRFQDTIGILVHDKNDFPCKICDVSKKGILWYNEGSLIPIVQRDYRLATEEEKQKLFQAIKDNGLRWNSKTKTLDVLIVPKFKVGDRIKNKNTGLCDTVIEVCKDCYLVTTCLDEHATISFDIQDNWELISNKFDINTLVPFESKVLVRDGQTKWLPAIWGFYNEDNSSYPYEIVGGRSFNYCIPYEGNEHLRGTINDCSEYYKIWE